MTAIEPEHSPKGGSSAERWMNCTGSGILLKKLQLPQSDEPEYRGLGVAAHAVAAHCLTNNLDTWEIMGETFEGKVVDDNMADAVQVYLDDVRPFMTKDATVLIEQRIGEDPEKRPHPDFYGRVDFAAYGKDDLIVEDYKHGEGIVVEPENNVQMLYYAYGIIYPRREHIRSDRPVRLRICQPRAFHPDGSIREWATTAGEVLNWGETVLVPAMKAAEIDNDFQVGEWCRFCPAKLFCPLMTSIYGAAMRADPAFIPNFGNERLGLEYQRRQAVKFYLKALEDEIFRRLNLGTDVPGTKLVTQRSNRVFKSGAKDIFIGRFGDAAVEPADLKSPAEMEKIGPEAKKLVSEWAFMPNNGLTVALETDKKQGIKMAKGVDIFQHLIDAEDPTNVQSDNTGDTNG